MCTQDDQNGNPKIVFHIIVSFWRNETHKVMAKDDGMPNSFVAVLVRKEGVALQGPILNRFQRDDEKNVLPCQSIDIRITFRDILLELYALLYINYQLDALIIIYS